MGDERALKGSGARLISELFSDPVTFEETGGANKLLKEYQSGTFPLDSLRPLLKSEILEVQCIGVFIAFEIGIGAQPFIHDIVPLIRSDDQSIRFDALQSVAVCSVGENLSEFVHVTDALTSDDEDLQVIAMFLVSNAGMDQLKNALEYYKGIDQLHARGLFMLIAGETIATDEILGMVSSTEILLRRYAAIGVRRLKRSRPGLTRAVLSSDDLELQRFAKNFFDQLFVE